MFVSASGTKQGMLCVYRTTSSSGGESMSRLSVVRVLAVAALGAAALLAPWSASSASSTPPQLRLVTVLHQTNVERFDGDNQLYVSPGVYLGAIGGPFEIDAYNNADGSVTLWQVNRNDTGVHKIKEITPPSPVSII